MYYLYIIRSVNRNYNYVGITNDPSRRISEHNNGYNKTTKPYLPFKTIQIEEYSNRKVTREREKYYKSGAGREKVKEIIVGMAEW